MVLYLWLFMPFKVIRLNYLNLIQEILLIFTFILSGLFIIGLDSRSQDILEYTMIGVVGINILLSYIYTILDGIIKIWAEYCTKKITPDINIEKATQKVHNIEDSYFEAEEDLVSNLNLNILQQESRFKELQLFVTPAISKKPSYASIYEIQDLQ